MDSSWIAFLFKHPVFQTCKIYEKFPVSNFRWHYQLYLLKFFSFTSVYSAKVRRANLKYCATASTYQLPNYENPTIRFHGIHVTAHHSGADEDSVLWFMMSCRLLNNDVLQRHSVLDFLVPKAGDDKLHRNVRRYSLAYLRKFNKGKWR